MTAVPALYGMFSTDAEGHSVQLSALDNEATRLAIPRLDLLIADVENSEIPMLEGAMGIILRDRPQLAICFYHSKEQFLGCSFNADEATQRLCV